MAILLLCLSFLLQLLAAYFSLRLIPISKGKRAWVLIAAALVIRSFRLSVTIYLAVFRNVTLSVIEEAVSLTVSLLLAIGVFSIRPLFMAFSNAQRVAEEANKAKDEFLANISHEIRTPLTVILTSTELAMQKPGESQELLQMSKNAGESLQEMVEDLLDLSSARRGHIKIVEELFSVRETVAKVDSMLRPRAISKGLSLESTVSSEIPSLVIGDGKRVKQILINLIANAIKFTESGGIRVSVKPIEEASGGSISIEFAVRDTGIGIPKDKLRSIFHPFVQVDASHTRPYEGVGLGLALCKSIVEKMGGRIWVESKEGAGSCFFLTLPFRVKV